MKKFLLSFLAGLVILFSFAPYFSPAKAQTWYNQSFQEWYGKVYDPLNPSEIFGERYTAAQVQWIIYGLFGFLINSTTGQQNTAIIQCFKTNITNIKNCESELTKLVSSLPEQKPLANMPQTNQKLLPLIFDTNRPISGISYIKGLVQKLSIVSTVRAAPVGFGFDALKQIQSMWMAIRNISFGLFVIVAVIFAFMIMFRVKLSPQTVVSIQSALPKIIVALILVTFSYAIAGLLIDLLYVVIGLFSLTLTPLIPTNFLQTSKYNVTDVFQLLTTGHTQTSLFGFQHTSLLSGIFNLLWIYFLPLTTLGLLVFAASLLISATGIGTIISIIGLLIIIIGFTVVVWTSIKAIYALFKAFAYVVLLTIFAPLHIALGVIVPGLGFGQWLKSYLSYLSVFAVTGVLWLFAWIFSLLAWDVLWSGSPPSSWPPLLGSGPFGFALALTGTSFVIFTLIPKATEIVQGFISGKPFAYGTAIGEAVGPVVMIGQTGIGVANTKRERQRENAAKLAGQEYNPDTLTQLLQQLKIIGGRH